MSVRLAVSRLWHHGLRFIRRTYCQGGTRELEKIVNPGPGARAPSLALSPFQPHIDSARRIFVDNVLRRVTNSLSGELRRRTTRQLLFGNSTPFFALVGVSLASGTGLITKEDELEGVCWEIRDAVRKMQKSMFAAQSEMFSENEEVSLASFNIGPPIAKGSCAVVYAASKNTQGSNGTVNFQPNEPVEGFPFVLKMMFNYDIESNALSILRAMRREMLPARQLIGDYMILDSILGMKHVRLDPHPNIVQMHLAFADLVPELPSAMDICPAALPPRLNPETGLARNMSLFLLMKRYDRTLKEHIARGEITSREAVLLLTQLLEGIAYINANQIAHRDIKSDNLFLDVGEEGCPVLVIGDFGCCLSGSLNLPFQSADTDRGGNPALMAPEVLLAEPGMFSSISYSKSDVWSAGAVGVEIMTGRNPFYVGPDGKRLYPTNFNINDLPDIPGPPVVAALIRSMLSVSLRERPTAELAATVMQLYLWAPTSWRQTYPVPSDSEILQWLLCLSTKVLCGTAGKQTSFVGDRRTDAEYLLIGSFLRRVNLAIIRKALRFMQGITKEE